MGGMISMQYAPRHPERVTAVVLNDIGPEVDPVGLARIVQYVGHAPEMFADLKAVTRYYRENYAPMVEHLPDDQIADFARWNVRRSDSGIYVWKMDPAVRSAAAAPPAIEPWDAVRGIACPLLVLRGEKSDVLSPDIAKRMVEEAKEASLVEVPGVGHAPVLTEPIAMKALDSFLPH
jgi:pimeloyl-ACP methyl ester carboxylesterase